MTNKNLPDLKVKPEDRIRLNLILEEMADIIHRSSDDPSLVIDFEYWAKIIFGHKPTKIYH